MKISELIKSLFKGSQQEHPTKIGEATDKCTDFLPKEGGDEKNIITKNIKVQIKEYSVEKKEARALSNSNTGCKFPQYNNSSDEDKESCKQKIKNEDTQDCHLSIESAINNIDSTLNEEQKDAVKFNGKHLLVLAGAGTGKTKTIIERAKFLIDSGVKPSRIMILSFTRKSAREIANRIKIRLSKDKAEGLSGQTFHSWCMGIIKNNPKIFPQADFTLLDEEDKESCIKLLAGRGYKKATGISPDKVLDVYSYAVNTQCSLSESMRVKLFGDFGNGENISKEKLDGLERDIKARIDKEKPKYEKLIQSYISYKEEHKYLDYDDILNIVSKALKQNESVRKYISSQYDHILVDEMQDTNPLQYELLSSFFDKCHLFCVGDDAQSIYAFRGADFNSIHSFHEKVKDSEVKKLTINYRSTKEILDLCNWIINQSPLKYSKDLVSVKGNGKMPVILHWNDEWEEADDITEKILNSISEEGFSYNDNMILSRSLKGLRKVESACLEKKIPYIIFGGVSLMKSRHIRDVASALRIVSNYKDEIAWNRYLHIWKGIGDVRSASIINEALSQKDFESCMSRLKEMNLQSEIYNTLYSIKDNQTNVPCSISIALKYMQERLKEIYHDEWIWRVSDFKILMDVAASTGSISEFVAEYVLDPKLETTLKNGNEETDLVTLSTIHSAKGLEAEKCYITNVSVFAFPSIRAINHGINDIEEERRCLYVAATRAKGELYIYRSIKSIHAEETEDEFNNHYFLNNVPDELFKHENIERSENRSIIDCYDGDKIEIKTDFDFR